MPDETIHPSTRILLVSGVMLYPSLSGSSSQGFTVGGAGKDVTVGKDMETGNGNGKVHAPHIERMDSRGTLSFEHFHSEYLRTQARQEETLRDLDKRVRQIEADGRKQP
jgi:hypothetical protein